MKHIIYLHQAQRRKDINLNWWSLTRSAEYLFVGGLEQGFALHLLATAIKKANKFIICQRQVAKGK